MSETEDLYDVSNYTDNQLYKILDITSPSDRELEARIMHLIRKYTNIQNESGEKLAQFYQDIYDHFFYDDDEEDQEDQEDEDHEESVREGFDTAIATSAIATSAIATSAATSAAPTTAAPTTAAPAKGDSTTDTKGDSASGKTKSQLITTAEYVPDSLRLNPLLKQTFKRIISIDSQYRDISVYKNSSSFSFDLSEPIRDVVSLKLNSVQIPYTWWVISKAYGANFFFLKGATEGINNGLHDYQISIPAANYSNETLIAAVNNSFKTLANTYTDVNFNDTGLTYDPAKTITTININIQKAYNEAYYQLNFPFWTTSVTTDDNRLSSLASYFGYNQPTYYPYSIHSSQTYATTTFIMNDTKRNFMFSAAADISNNYFKVIHYVGPLEYDPDFSTVVDTITITLYDDIYNTNLDRLRPVDSSMESPPYMYSRAEIFSMVNKAIQKSGKFTSDSGMYQYDIVNLAEGNVANAGYTCFKLNLKFDRNAVKYGADSKMLVIFPNETPANFGDTTVWTLHPDATNSCFYFDNKQNEYSTFISESTILQSSYNVGSNTRVFFRCINPPYMSSGYNGTDFSGNDFVVPIPTGTYTLTEFITIMNSELAYAQTIGNTTKGITFANANPFSINSDSKFKFSADMLKTFTQSDYRISFDESSVLCSVMGFTPQTNVNLGTTNVFQSTFDIQYSGYILDSTYLFTISPNPTTANKYEPNNIVNLDSTNFANYSQFISGTINSITQYTIVNSAINDTQYPYSQTTLTYTVNPARTQITVTLTVYVHYLLNEGNYQVEFLDGAYPITDTNNSWHPFSINQTYELYPYTLNPSPPPAYLPYATILGNGIVNQNQITVTDANNTITITPYYDASGGAYTENNNITLTIPTGTYIITQLYSLINWAFDMNPQTSGSTISTIIINNREYVKIRLNINRIYTTSDYNLVFYDPISFVKCTTGGQSVQNTTWDTTLGWILGFRSYTQYELILENQRINQDFPDQPYYLMSYTSVYKHTTVANKSNLVTNTIINFSGDTTLTTILYNYFVIALDDYNQNRINDGLVTITRPSNSVEVPAYSAMSETICDPVTGNVINKPIPDPKTRNKLTQNQIYALNQATTSRQAKTKTYSPGPFIKDLFGFIPIKNGTPGTYYIESGGAMQTQERLYFGPVNIRKMTIQLMNDRGDLVDLNGSNWSFSFIIEQLYRSGNSGSSK